MFKKTKLPFQRFGFDIFFFFLLYLGGFQGGKKEKEEEEGKGREAKVARMALSGLFFPVSENKPY